ncbi:hypothetical protein NA57DRAFT_56626 [Rhizodiscina lignyota]|uniref:Uncharacterized protein n=1 Tax=Rhizodiscina lignyota TaxID=1504668 RepID=A0A9P4M5S4_9PEZI|nr:hypothetical protein NA57DRAFT_56626 [Rhizodiscina lignyota]
MPEKHIDNETLRINVAHTGGLTLTEMLRLEPRSMENLLWERCGRYEGEMDGMRKEIKRLNGELERQLARNNSLMTTYVAKKSDYETIRARNMNVEPFHLSDTNEDLTAHNSELEKQRDRLEEKLLTARKHLATERALVEAERKTNRLIKAKLDLALDLIEKLVPSIRNTIRDTVLATDLTELGDGTDISTPSLIPEKLSPIHSPSNSNEKNEIGGIKLMDEKTDASGEGAAEGKIEKEEYIHYSFESTIAAVGREKGLLIDDEDEDEDRSPTPLPTPSREDTATPMPGAIAADDMPASAGLGITYAPPAPFPLVAPVPVRPHRSSRPFRAYHDIDRVVEVPIYMSAVQKPGFGVEDAVGDNY